MKRTFDGEDDVDGSNPSKRRKITPTLVSVPVLFAKNSQDSNSNTSSDESDSDDESSVDSYYQLHMNPKIILESKSQVLLCHIYIIYIFCVN